jgi:thiamine kinase-like enzyme
VAMPHLTGHGDACAANLLAGPDGDFVLIDFGFWNVLPVAFDLGQLLVGEVQLGRQPASTVPETDAAIVAAYVEGLRAEGCDIPESTVRRAHALQLLLFTGLSSVPVEFFDAPPTPALERLAADRAEVAAYSLDLVGASGASA